MPEENEKVFRNLQEQVAKNQYDILKILQSLGRAIPDPIPGPKGDTGNTGERGPMGETGYGIIGYGTELPESARLGDWFILKGNDDEGINYWYCRYINHNWIKQFSVRGPKGPVGGSGGSSVIPNPEEESTDILSTIEIDGVVYSLSFPDDIYPHNVFASDEIEFSDENGDFGTNAKDRINSLIQSAIQYIVEQSKGQSTTKVMSQKATTDAIAEFSNYDVELSITFVSGKMVYSKDGGIDWRDYLTDNGSSIYSQEAIDVSSYIGQKLKIAISGDPGGSTRVFGFCNSNNIVSSAYYERDFTFEHIGNKYVAYVDITDDYFFYSGYNWGTNPIFSITVNNFTNKVKEITYDKEEIDNKISNSVVYVDATNGNDNNDGSQSHPLKTINAGISKKTKFVLVSPNDYNEQVNISNRNDLFIMPTNYGSYSSSSRDTPKIHITGGSGKSIQNGVNITNSNNIHLIAIHTENTSLYGFGINNSKDLEFTNCIASNCNEGGFVMTNTDAIFRNCIAHDIGIENQYVADGFNMHGYGNTQFYDCFAYNCTDDGISHHDGCTGFICGGEFYNCAKGGISSPCYGAYVDVCNAYSHDNKYGLYAVNDGYRTVKAIINNCVFKNNDRYDIYMLDANSKGWNNIYDTKYVEGTFTEFN